MITFKHTLSYPLYNYQAFIYADLVYIYTLDISCRKNFEI